MKKLLIVLLFLGSVSSFSHEKSPDCDLRSYGSEDNRTLKLVVPGQRILRTFNEVQHDDFDLGIVISYMRVYQNEGVCSNSPIQQKCMIDLRTIEVNGDNLVKYEVALKRAGKILLKGKTNFMDGSFFSQEQQNFQKFKMQLIDIGLCF